MLLAGGDVLHLDSSLVRTFPPSWTGELVAFTADTLIHLRSQASPNLDGGPELERQTPCTVTASAWGRRTLQRVDLLGDDDYPWSHEWAAWPLGASLRLHYSAGQVLTLPLNDQAPEEPRRTFAEFYPSLIRDLEQRVGPEE